MLRLRVSLFALTCLLLAGCSGSTVGAVKTATRTAGGTKIVSGTPTTTAITLPSPGEWRIAPGFEGKQGVTFAVAPSTAFAYTLQDAPAATPSKFGPAQRYTLESTHDSGKTWQALTLPVAQPQSAQSSDYGIADLFAAPSVGVPMLYITIQLGTAALCQPFGGGLGRSGSFCAVQFLSGDEGHTWQRVHLPADAPQEVGDPVLSNHFIIQGKYTYTAEVDYFNGSGTPPVPRIVVSSGDLTQWHLADSGLVSKGLGVDFFDGVGGDFSSTLYAVVEPVDTTTLRAVAAENPPYYPGHLQLYRVDNLGSGSGSWTFVGDLPHNSVDSLRVTTVAGGQGAPQVIYVTSSLDATTPNSPATRLAAPVLEYFDNAGLGWEVAPTDGIPAGYAVQGGNGNALAGAIAATFDDGSALVFFTLSSNPGPKTALFAWKLGGSAWQSEGAPFSAARITSFSVVTQNGADGRPVPYAFYLVTDTGAYRCQLT